MNLKRRRTSVYLFGVWEMARDGLKLDGKLGPLWSLCFLRFCPTFHETKPMTGFVGTRRAWWWCLLVEACWKKWLGDGGVYLGKVRGRESSRDERVQWGWEKKEKDERSRKWEWPPHGTHTKAKTCLNKDQIIKMPSTSKLRRNLRSYSKFHSTCTHMFVSIRIIQICQERRQKTKRA